MTRVADGDASRVTSGQGLAQRRLARDEPICEGYGRGCEISVDRVGRGAVKVAGPDIWQLALAGGRLLLLHSRFCARVAVPVEAKPLFRPDVLRPHVEAFTLPYRDHPIRTDVRF